MINLYHFIALDNVVLMIVFNDSYHSLPSRRCSGCQIRETCAQTVFLPSSPRLLLECCFGWYFISSRMIPRKESHRPWTWLGSWFPRSVGYYKIYVLVTLKKDHLYHLVDPEWWLNAMKASSITRQRLRVTFFVTFYFCCCCYKSFSTCLFHVTKWMSECFGLDWPLAIFLKCVSPISNGITPTKFQYMVNSSDWQGKYPTRDVQFLHD